jgi:hypothetical protein
MLTSGGQLAMLIVIILGYFQVVETPQGPFIGIIAFILLGQIGTQVCIMARYHSPRESLYAYGFCSCKKSSTKGLCWCSNLPTSYLDGFPCTGMGGNILWATL